MEVWAGDLAGDRIALVLLNRSGKTANITAEVKDIGVGSRSVVTIRNLWTHESISLGQNDTITAEVASHDVAALELALESRWSLQQNYLLY